MQSNHELVEEMMMEFARRTGLDPVGKQPRRYLWTDSFAVCNFLELHYRTKDDRFLDLALSLVDQVHETLGRHREDDRRSGWISGLSEEEGRKHPTRGGLRIGKPLPERDVDETPDEELEWDQDGQYFHYLAKWMHALDRACRATGETRYAMWGIELAQAAHASFVYSPGAGRDRRMHWKMSIDLSRPLVLSMGQHDPLDGYVTFLELQTLASSLPSLPEGRYLAAELADIATIMNKGIWITDDPLGIGGLLFDACRIDQLMRRGAPDHSDLLRKVLDSALPGVESFAGSSALQLPSKYRLAFRELGLSIGLRAVERLNMTSAASASSIRPITDLARRLQVLTKFASVGEGIERFWTDPSNQKGPTWLEHEDINVVMLATSLAPGSFLSI